MTNESYDDDDDRSNKNNGSKLHGAWMDDCREERL